MHDGRYTHTAPKGQDNLAQGLPRVYQKNVFSPEGAFRSGDAHGSVREPILAVSTDPFRVQSLGKLTQG
jgi:hypothetical protein